MEIILHRGLGPEQPIGLILATADDNDDIYVIDPLPFISDIVTSPEIER
jgi:hypothetical protein